MVEEAGENAVPAGAAAPPGGSGPRRDDLVRGSSSDEPGTVNQRSAINTRNATKHGYYGKHKRLTTELVEALMKKLWSERREMELCEEWREDSHQFVDYIIEHHGARQHRDQKLRRFDELLPFAPGNVQGWEYQRPRPRRGAVRAALLSGDIGPLLDCACDHRAQLDCSRSPRPCHWSIAARESAPWAESAEGG